MAKQNKKVDPTVEAISNTIPENGMVWIIGNESSEHLKTGKEFYVTSTLAKTLINKGEATLKNN